MTTLFAIDPGQTVGWAFIRNNGEGQAHGEDDLPSFCLKLVTPGTYLNHIYNQYLKGKVDIILVEEIVPVGLGSLADDLRELDRTLHKNFPDMVTILPGEWKNSPFHQELRRSEGPEWVPGRHSADAFWMGQYYLDKLERDHDDSHESGI